MLVRLCNPGNTCIRRWSSFFQVMVSSCYLISTKPSAEPMVNRYKHVFKLGTQSRLFWNLNEVKTYPWRNCNLRMTLYWRTNVRLLLYRSPSVNRATSVNVKRKYPLIDICSTYCYCDVIVELNKKMRWLTLPKNVPSVFIKLISVLFDINLTIEIVVI